MPEVSNLFVCLMGMGVTFFGLICLILLTMLMGKLVRGKQEPTPAVQAAPAPVSAASSEPNRQEMIAAVSAVLAEELGTDVSAIRILSFRKVS